MPENDLILSNDATSTRYTTNSHLKKKVIKGAKSHALWEKEHPNLTLWGYLAASVPFVVAASPALAAASESAVGITEGLTTIANAVPSKFGTGISLTAAAKGANDIIHGKFTPKTALEVSPIIPAVPIVLKSAYTMAKEASPTSVKLVLDVTEKNPFRLSNYRFLKDPRFYADLENPYLLSQRAKGRYPLTFSERRQFITQFKKDVMEGVDFTKKEAFENLKTSLVPRNGKDLFPSDVSININFGTRGTMNIEPTHKYPNEVGYNAIWSDGKIRIPFRNRRGTLTTHLPAKSSRVSIGAHEARHSFLNEFEIPLSISYEENNNQLPKDFLEVVNNYVKYNLNEGKWEGSLAEMDAELSGWSAKFGFPSKYSRMTPLLKVLLYKLFERRFGDSSSEPSGLWKVLKNPTDENIQVLDDTDIVKIIKNLEALGYRKNGGKLE